MTGPLLLVTFMLVATVALALVLVHVGERDGDRPGDASVRVRLVRPSPTRPGHPVVSVEVGNPSPSPLVVSTEVRRALPLALSLRAPRRVTVPRRPRSARPEPGLILGAVETGCSRSWVVPLSSSSRAAKVSVRLHQAGGRTPVVAHLIGIQGPRRVGRWTLISTTVEA